MKYWQPEYETMNHNELDKLQLDRLKKTVAKVYNNVLFYRNKFDQAKVTPSDIRSLDDISKLAQTKNLIFGTIIHLICLQYQKRNCADTLIIRYKRKAHCCWIYIPGYRELVRHYGQKYGDDRSYEG